MRLFEWLEAFMIDSKLTYGATLTASRGGRRKFGVWWLVFSGALLLIVVVLITFAALLYLIILPSLHSA